MTGPAVGVAAVVEARPLPATLVVAAGALAIVMVSWCSFSMTGPAVGVAAVIKCDICPSAGRMALRALAVEMVLRGA